MRKDDSKSKSFFRSTDRVFQANGSWWFAAREGDYGPFTSRQAAQDGLRSFVLEVRGSVDLDEISILEKDEDGSSAWDTRPDVIR